VELSFWTSFLGGVLTFFSPCVLPLIPVYLGLITGLSFEELKEKRSLSDLSGIAIKLLLFILGFSIVFVLLGATGAAVGRFLIRYKFLLLKFAGLLMVVFGLYLFGILKIPFLERVARINVDTRKRGGLISSFVFGTVFGLAWSPCSGPILGAIVLLASTSANVAKGATYLFAYSIGIAVPLFISGLLFSYFISFLSKYRKFFHYVDKAAGLLLFLVGLLFLTGNQYILFILE
jgi:cytochrome c-type biogenesis protein